MDDDPSMHDVPRRPFQSHTSWCTDKRHSTFSPCRDPHAGNPKPPQTDWKAVADELFFVIVGMAAGASYQTGRSVKDAQDRMDRLRANIIEHNTR